MADQAYETQDTLYLWWLGDPRQPRLIGELRLLRAGRAVALQYDPTWLSTGFPLSEDLPLRADLYVPPQDGMAAGAVDDARPERWGERVIRKFEQAPRLSILEYLLFAGDDRFGAMSVSQSPLAYVPWPCGPIPNLARLNEIAEVVGKVLADEPVPKPQRSLLRAAAAFGGTRPKSVMTIDGEPWLVKFSAGDELDMELIEHATMTLAAGCRVDVAATRVLSLPRGHAVAIRRFDRAGAKRLHALSANVVLRAAGHDLGYPQLAQLLPRLAPAAEIAQQQQQLFRRMVFNILMDNTDDHEKNHALLRTKDGSYSLAPAFDVVPSAQGVGYQAMLVGDAGAESTLQNVLTQAPAFGMNEAMARTMAEEVARHVEGWKEHFQVVGVGDGDIAVLAQYLDGDALGRQRREFARAARTRAGKRY